MAARLRPHLPAQRASAGQDTSAPCFLSRAPLESTKRGDEVQTHPLNKLLRVQHRMVNDRHCVLRRSPAYPLLPRFSQCFSQGGPQTRSLSIARELVKTANSRAASQTS